ncbi:unnamed protein product [Cladocopium goreaui]|uniref:Phosphatidylinositol 4-phosphate 5-kinase 7 n=1 Tax=Cladocopium goreaui TaxID=2562237 RepID=A0A9P1BUY8_9DINO|nr:unnamed protein product [Cladocopium goreaui]
MARIVGPGLPRGWVAQRVSVPPSTLGRRAFAGKEEQLWLKRSLCLDPILSHNCRFVFGSSCTPESSATHASCVIHPRKKVPPETPEEVTKKLKEQRDYWDKQERSKVKVILSQWGGLLFFGFWCGIAWLGKKWGEYEMAIVEREMAEPRRYRRRSEE